MDSKIDHSAQNIADQRGPYAAPCATGLSPDVRRELPKLGSEKKGRVLNVVARKSGEQSYG
jgi:hypothetical protein